MHGSSKLVLGAVLSILGLLPALAAEEEAGSRPTLLSGPIFEVQRIDGGPGRGQLVQLRPDGTLVLQTEEGDEKSFAIGEVFALRRPDASDPSPTGEPLILLPEGDRLHAMIDQIQEGRLEVRPAVLEDESLAIPLDRVLGLILNPPSGPTEREALRERVRSEPRASEVLWLANGDRLAGTLVGLQAERMALELDTGRVEVPQASVLALGFDPALLEYPEPARPYLELSFVDGSRLGVAAARIENGRLIATTRFGVEIRPELKMLARVLVRSDRVVFLSERRESAAEYVGYLGRHPGSYGRDRTWDGHPLRLGGAGYDRGLGTLPRTLLAYVLDAGDRRFQALVGLDDRAGKRGCVVFRVLVDGQERFATPPLTPRDPPVPIDVKVDGGRVLILVTEFGASGDVEDSADWVEARLIRDSHPGQRADVERIGNSDVPDPPSSGSSQP